MFCDEGFQATGTINLNGASIGAQLNFRGAHLDGKGEAPLTAQRLTVTASMFCDEGFQATGTINLNGASVGAQLNFRGAHLDGKDGPALTAQRLTVTESMFCDEGFRAHRGDLSERRQHRRPSYTFAARTWTARTGPL